MLEREEKERLFSEHIEALAKKKKELFRQLLDETAMVQPLLSALSFYVYKSCASLCILACGWNANKNMMPTCFLPIDHTNINMEGGQKEHQRGSKVYEVFK